MSEPESPTTTADLPTPPAWFLTIRYDAETGEASIDLGDLDHFQAIGLLRMALREAEESAPAFHGLWTEDDEDEDE